MTRRAKVDKGRIVESEAQVQPAMSRSKYRAIPTVVDNVRFASKREALYYMQLKALQKAGRIKDLELQPKFPMPTSDTHNLYAGMNFISKKGCICTYVADFRYTWAKGPDAGKTVVVDVKGMKTPVFRLKMRLMQYFYPNTVVTLA